MVSLTTKVAFLRGPLLALGSPTREESIVISEMPTRLRPAVLPLRSGVERVIAFAARDPTTTLLGGVSLEDIDWVKRSARLVARWPEERSLQKEVLALALRYATGELALSQIVAQPDDEVWRRALTQAGFQGESTLAFQADLAWPSLSKRRSTTPFKRTPEETPGRRK